MVPDTRIGLVVGLAFIVCFAIVLANRSPSPRAPSSVTSPAGAARHPVTVSPGRDPSLFHPGVQPHRITTHRAGRTVSPTVGRNAEHPAPIRTDRDDAVELPASGAIVIVGHPPARVARRSAGLSAAEPAPVAATQDARAGPRRYRPVAHDGRGRHTSDRMLASLARRQTAAPHEGAGDGVERRPVRPEDRVPRHPTRHRVVRGETLSKLAAAYYGTRSSRVIRALFETNRAVLDDPDLLPVGVKLTLPDVPGLQRRGRASGSTVSWPAAPVEPARARATRPPPAPRWYQIKRNDRYVSIARDQLGDASRWREIFELNKDRFPDSNRIRAGVRIKLPATPAAHAGGRGG